MRAVVVAITAGLALAACAHTPDLALRLDPAPPIGSTTEVVTTPDGIQLFARHWAPIEAPKAIVVIMHGLKDHSARYAGFATRLTGAGYSVYAFDLRGHGRSSGKRVAPGRWWSYVDDLDRFLASIEAREPGRPVFVFGHSMGGAIAAAAAIQHRPTIAGLILSGPALVVDAPPILLAATRMAGALTPGAPALKLPNGDFSSAPGAKAAIDADPLISQPAGPARTAAGLIDGMHRIWAHVGGLTMPLLALHGSADRLTAPSGSRALIEAAPATDKTLRIYDGFFHDLLHEPRGKEVEDDIVAWLDAHNGGAPVTPPAVYRGPLGGDPRGWTQSIAIASGIGFQAADGAGAGFDDDKRFVGELAVQLARPRPFGWHGSLTGRIVGRFKAATLAPIGAAITADSSGKGHLVVGLATGGTLLSGAHFAVPATLWADYAFRYVHLTYSFELYFRLGGHPPRDQWIDSDGHWEGVTLGLNRDRRYWPHAIAGVGPTLTYARINLDGVKAFTLMVGFDLFGAD